MSLQTSRPVGLPIDPRIRQRRIEVVREQGRRRLRALLVALTTIATGIGGWAALGSALLDVDHIRVSGARHTPREAVLAASGIRNGDAMVHVKEAEAVRGVGELVWVERARVRRQWPNTVLITVQERRPSAVARTDSGAWALLDVTGRVLAVGPERPEGLVELEGVLGASSADVRPGEQAAALAGPLEVVRSLTPGLARRTVAVVVVQSGEIALKLNPRGTVRLGTADLVAAKVRAAETVLASIDVDRLAVLDVRLPASPVLTRG